jgi:hypothetical protein
MMGRPGRLVRGQGLPGAILWIWKPPVPYVPLRFVGCSVFLYGSVADAESGTSWGGSGFLVGVPAPSEVGRAWVHLYAVTNDHVIHQSPVIRLTKADGTIEVLGGHADDWTPHPGHDDVAVRSLGLCPDRDYLYVDHQELVTPGELETLEVAPGDNCLMVGRYIGREDRQFERPVVRFGNVAMSPPELVRQPQRGRDQESFLVDMRSLVGFSGSPVLVFYEEPTFRLKLGETPPDDLAGFSAAGHSISGVVSKAWLLGIDWGHLPVTAEVLDGNRNKVGDMSVNSGMAAVVPAWKLADLLNQEAFVRSRKETEEKLEQEPNEGGVLDASTEPEQDEFKRFEDLTRKLVNTPKKELDEKRKDEA